MDKKELSLEEIHKETLKILDVIIKICDKLNINYYVAYGTLLGAVRHQGYIPWDDDLDIMMLRPEYDRFCEYCYKHEDELWPFKLLTRDNHKGYPYNIARMNDFTYKAVYGNVKEYESGTFIDIYPLDGAGNADGKEMKALRKKKENLFRLALWSIKDRFEPSTYNKWYRTLLKRVIWCYIHLRGQDYFLDRLNNLGKRFDYNHSDYVAEMVWDGDLPLLKKEWFSTFQFLKFENRDVKVPIGYQQLLETMYGTSYMELPPKEKQKPQHDYKIFVRDKCLVTED